MIWPSDATRRDVERSRREQGLPPTVADPATLAKIADMIDEDLLEVTQASGQAESHAA